MPLPVIPVIATLLAAGAAGSMSGKELGPDLKGQGSFTPYSSVPGLQPSPYTPETGLWDAPAPNASPWNKVGLAGIPDYTTPGQSEATWAGNRNNWNAIGKDTQSWWNQATPQMQQTGQGTKLAYETAKALPVGPMPGPQNAQGAYNSLNLTTPDVSREANLGKYYDAAKARLTQSINDQSAARGTWGASTTGEQINQGMTDLEAQRAKEEADYALQALGEERAWKGLKQTGAASADQANVNQYLAEAQRANTMGNLGLSADEAERQRLSGWLESTRGMEDTRAGGMAAEEQAARQVDQDAYNRVQTLLGAQSGLAQQLDSIYGPGFNDMIANDQDLMNAIIAVTLGQDAAAVASASGSGVKSIAEAQGLASLFGM